jgi:hypothetical protein
LSYKSRQLRKRLIKEGATFIMDKAIQIAQNMEYAKQQIMAMGHIDVVDVHLFWNKPKQENWLKKEKQNKCFKITDITYKISKLPRKREKM